MQPLSKRTITLLRARFIVRQASGFLPALLLLLLQPLTARAPQKVASATTPDGIKAIFGSVPCKNQDRFAAVQELFRKAGAPASDITIDEHKDVSNLIVRKPGLANERLIIGAHYDKVDAGCGALDNWTGIVTVTELYKALKDAPLKKTVLFVAFGKEEKGLVGSHALAEAIPRADLNQYCEMINIDSLGQAAPQVADNMSSDKLQKLAADIASELKIPYGHASLRSADSDSSSFLKRKIPAVTIHGLTFKGLSMIHTSQDEPASVNSVSVYMGYRLVLAMLVRLDALPCNAYR